MHRWNDDLGSQGIKANKDTLYEYISYFEKALFMHTVVNKLWEDQVYIDVIRRGKEPMFWERP